MPTGIVIHESGTIDLLVTNNSGNTNAREDLVICEHDYQEVQNGTPANYSVVKGPMDGSKPTLPNPEKQVIVGYFTLCNKSFVIKNTQRNLSSSIKRRLSKFAQYDADAKQYTLSAPLIGQLGKNDNYKDLITGDDLLKFACDAVKEVQVFLGGRYVYLECEDNQKLLDFYGSNGFVNFGRRELECDEKNLIGGSYLIQMLKYLK